MRITREQAERIGSKLNYTLNVEDMQAAVNEVLANAPPKLDSSSKAKTSRRTKLGARLIVAAVRRSQQSLSGELLQNFVAYYFRIADEILAQEHE